MTLLVAVLLCDAADVLASALTVTFVPSTDLNRSRRFYEEVLGFSVAKQDSFAVVLDAGPVPIRVTNVGDAFNVQPFTVLGWEVGDIQAEVTELVERGVGFLRVGIACNRTTRESGLHPTGPRSPGSRIRTGTRCLSPSAPTDSAAAASQGAALLIARCGRVGALSCSGVASTIRRLGGQRVLAVVAHSADQPRQCLQLTGVRRSARRVRSLVIAPFIAFAITGAATFANPFGVPRLRSLIRVPSDTDSQV